MPLDKIIVRDLLLRGIIGLNDWEREKKQDILINLTLFTDTRRGGATDQASDILNYRTITKAVIAHVEDSAYYTVEALAAAIAERILRREPSIEPERVRTTVHEALVHLEKRERITLRMNPADLEALKAQNIALLEEFDAIDDLEIIPDDSVAPGGCVAQSELLEVDARMESQFQKIVDALLE